MIDATSEDAQRQIDRLLEIREKWQGVLGAPWDQDECIKDDGRVETRMLRGLWDVVFRLGLYLKVTPDKEDKP